MQVTARGRDGAAMQIYLEIESHGRILSRGMARFDFHFSRKALTAMLIRDHSGSRVKNKIDRF